MAKSGRSSFSFSSIIRSAAGFGTVGLVAAFIFSIVWIVAACADPSWTLGEDFVSKLGVSGVSLAADLFNYGCIIAGILLFVYGIGKAYAYKGSECASGMLFAVSGLLLVLIGLVHSGNTYHSIIAVLLFVFLVFAIIAAAATDAKEGRMLNAAVGACVLAAALITFLCVSEEMGEAVMIAGTLAFVVADSLKMIFDRDMFKRNMKIESEV